jgi:hypothetical protein
MIQTTEEALSAVQRGLFIGSGFMLGITLCAWAGDNLLKLLHWAVCR